MNKLNRELYDMHIDHMHGCPVCKHELAVKIDRYLGRVHMSMIESDEEFFKELKRSLSKLEKKKLL